jgi:signal transduction histidine kinase
MNLLTNAISYAQGTDEITVSVGRSDTHAVLSVTDKGPGIDPDMVKPIFDRFVQVRPDERPGTAGLGLGLYISQEIVHGHGGAIEVDSIPGSGSTFTVRLPLAPSGAEAASSISSSQSIPGQTS